MNEPNGSDANAAAIFGTTFPCPCGKTHRIEPDAIVFAPDAVARAAEVCAAATSGRKAAVLFDARTGVVAGQAVAAALRAGGFAVETAVVEDRPGGRSPICDDTTKDALHRRIAPADLFVPVGSGVVNDLGKWLAFDRGAPFVTFATAASMNGYTSANIAPTLGGVKSLLRARPPRAVLACPQVLADAPYVMTAAGLGDVLAKSVSSTDWYLNHLVFGDYYCARSVGLIAAIEPMYLEHPADVRQRTPGAIAALFDALLLTGAAMTMAESSAPSSGGEHMVSHCLDMMSQVDGVDHDLHGRQVGVGTVLASEVYRRVLAIESPKWGDAPAAIDAKFWGPLAGAVAKQYADKQPRLHQARQLLEGKARWDALRGQLAPMLRTPEKIAGCLRQAGAACSAADIGCDRARLLAAFGHAHEIRSRFTILDLAHLVGVLPSASQEIVQEWA